MVVSWNDLVLALLQNNSLRCAILPFVDMVSYRLYVEELYMHKADVQAGYHVGSGVARIVPSPLQAPSQALDIVLNSVQITTVNKVI